MYAEFFLDLFSICTCAVAAVALGLMLRVQGAAAMGVAAAAAAVVLIQLNGRGLQEIGLRGPPDLAAIGYLVLAGLTVSYVVAGSVSSALSRIGLAPDVTRLDFIKGNLPALLMMLALSWTTAAFGEEIVFRGFLLNRMAALDTGIENWPWIAVVLQAALFGLAHAYQGIGGVIVTGALGAVLGGLTIAAEGDLWPAVLVHGLINSFSLTSIFLGKPSRNY